MPWLPWLPGDPLATSVPRSRQKGEHVRKMKNEPGPPPLVGNGLAAWGGAQSVNKRLGVGGGPASGQGLRESSLVTRGSSHHLSLLSLSATVSSRASSAPLLPPSAQDCLQEPCSGPASVRSPYTVSSGQLALSRVSQRVSQNTRRRPSPRERRRTLRQRTRSLLPPCRGRDLPRPHTRQQAAHRRAGRCVWGEPGPPGAGGP